MNLWLENDFSPLVTLVGSTSVYSFILAMLNLSHLQLRKNSSFRQKKQGQDFFFWGGGYFCLSALFCCLFVFYVFIILYYTWYHHFSAMKVNKYCVLIIFSSHLQVHFISYFSYTVIFYLSIPVCLTRLSERWPKQWWSLSSTATCRLTLLGSHSTSTEPPPSTTAWLLCTTAVFAIRWEVM